MNKMWINFSRSKYLKPSAYRALYPVRPFCMKFREVAEVYQRIEDVNPKRLEILKVLSQFITDKYEKKEVDDIKNFL